MAPGTSAGHLLLMAFICQGLGCCHTQDNSSASPHNQGSISINTVTYPVIDSGCCRLMSRIGSEGQVRLGVTFEKIGDQCAQIHRDHEELFGKVAKAVAHITAANRLQLLEVLTDSMSTLDASDVDVKPSYTSIDMLQMKLQGISAPTAVRPAKHSHALNTEVAPVRYAYSSTTVRTTPSAPLPLRGMTATPAPLPMASAMMPPPVITQPLMPPQASYGRYGFGLVSVCGWLRRREGPRKDAELAEYESRPTIRATGRLPLSTGDALTSKTLRSTKATLTACCGHQTRPTISTTASAACRFLQLLRNSFGWTYSKAEFEPDKQVSFHHKTVTDLLMDAYSSQRDAYGEPVDPDSGYMESIHELHSIHCTEGGCPCKQGPDAGARTSLAARVARTREPLRIAYGTKDPRYPDIASADDTEMAFTLAHPLLQPDGELTGVLELYRRIGSPMFYEEDEEIVNSYLVWGGIALHYAEMYSIMARQRKLHSFLLAVVRSIFQDMISMDSVIVKIMAFAQKLVSADRASLFLVDSRTKELYARIFDVSGDNDEVQEVAKEIRFPLGTGIAGHVAQTGESLNIPDAYEDDRFNRAVDQQTGYTTKSLLCMPIFIRGSIIGVMQMAVKRPSDGSQVHTIQKTEPLYSLEFPPCGRRRRCYDAVLANLSTTAAF
ncbi:putative 3',5'-cyclic phosphodiesterase pde-5 isoform X2 [Ixodes scapularis]